MSTPKKKTRADRARDIALYRYSLIRPLADPGLSPTERGRLVRELAAQVHLGPSGEPVTVSRASLDRWIRAWRAGGFDALIPAERQVAPRTDAEALELAARLKREHRLDASCRTSKTPPGGLQITIESTFATVRNRSKITKSPGSRAAGLAMAFKLIEAAQSRWRAVNAPHLVALVRAGAKFENGKLVERPDNTITEAA